MLDMGWMEIMVIGVVALIVVGPKDLPRMLRTLGQYTGKMRGMAREFQRSMDDAAREADLAEFKDIKKSLDDVRQIQTSAKQSISKTLMDTDREIEKAVDLKPVTVPTPPSLDTDKAPQAESPVPTPRTGTDGA